jgi:hypothetical protein
MLTWISVLCSRHGIFTVGPLVTCNLYLCYAMVQFLIRAQGHVGDPLIPPFIIIITIIFLLSIFYSAFEPLAPKSCAKKAFYRYFSIIIIFNALYWIIALILADGACIKCGGFSPFIYFWVPKSWLLK